MATPNRNSSPTYRWATPFTRLRKENSFGKFVKSALIVNAEPPPCLILSTTFSASFFLLL
ncbi:hypothetical protein FKQ51_31525 [Bacillus toyonensis]|nr:hypothetical protein [Bacillus toyonensis]